MQNKQKQELNLRNMITGSRNNCSTKSWPTRNLFSFLTILTYQGNISGLCLSSGCSNSNPSNFNKL